MKKKYDKADVPFDELYPKMNTAIQNAAKIDMYNKQSNKNSPSTKVHLLINELLKIKEEREKR